MQRRQARNAIAADKTTTFDKIAIYDFHGTHFIALFILDVRFSTNEIFCKQGFLSEFV